MLRQSIPRSLRDDDYGNFRRCGVVIIVSKCVTWKRLNIAEAGVNGKSSHPRLYGDKKPSRRRWYSRVEDRTLRIRFDIVEPMQTQ